MTYDDSLTKIHITQPLTSKTIVELMEDYPNLEKITCSKSLYDRISKKYISALKELEIIVEISYEWGRKPIYGDEIGNKVIELVNNGVSPEKIANTLNISLKTVYYLNNKFSNHDIKLKRGRKIKYDSVIRNKIKNLHDKGVKPKEIAQLENIPLRSVYYIINSF
ncbi:helix-turn-helix domain-containing protein [Methanobrevibacter filiformis]|uniref:Orotate phosphoribosyltransferase-like protein n=1 Tax=Methanobrevibacter filiformis TaxID=55758 RepID=A0A166D224_9EURY|nr:helix-turn-helix domain-containing protein [Methanobrevibacter filiformis]KZX15123.1 orotate phosphoribosyltransferase-like protein [Methanobrevibacter filiformis]